MANKVTITGKIVSGLKQGAFFTQLGWVKSQCRSHLGYGPYPGTLNIEVSPPDLPTAQKLLEADGKRLVPPDTTFCSGKLFPVTIESIPAAIVIPATAVRSHEGGIVEVIAAVSLRETLGLSDGDTVSLVLK